MFSMSELYAIKDAIKDAKKGWEVVIKNRTAQEKVELQFITEELDHIISVCEKVEAEERGEVKAYRILMGYDG